MSGTVCESVIENCQNFYDSYGEICVGCNCCGRFGTDTMWQARYELAVRMLRDDVEKLTDEYFQSNLQQQNICSNISYWSERLKEILTHLDFDKKKYTEAEPPKGE